VILHDAATLFVTIIDRAVLTVQILAAALAFMLCVIGFCAGPLITPGARAARRAVARPAAPVPVRRRPVPSWAHTEPYDREEAA
jgi:hypothetical protein